MADKESQERPDPDDIHPAAAGGGSAGDTAAAAIGPAGDPAVGGAGTGFPPADVAADPVGSASATAVSAHPFDIPDLNPAGRTAAASQGIDLLRDVELNVKIELGRSRMLVEDVLRLGEGSVVELDKLAGDPVDVFVNNRLVARGEVLVLNDNFCVRINEIVARNGEDGWA